MPEMRWSTPLLLIVAVFLSAPQVYGQGASSAQASEQGTSGSGTTENVAFATLRFGLSGGTVFRDSGMSGWTPGADARLTVDSPYAGGRLRFDGAFRAWTGKTGVQGILDRNGNERVADLPDVRTVDIMAGWGLANAWDAPISLDAGLLIGNRFMLFDLPEGTAGRIESEMLAGPWARIGRKAGRVRAFVEVRALRVLTRPRWDTIGISGGLAFEARTPQWIRWILL